MRSLLVTTPMPTAISTVAEAESLFGVGSQMARACRIAIEGHPERLCACGRSINGTFGSECGPCYRRSQRFDALMIAFARVSECIEVVETRAAALFVSDINDERSLTEWRAEAFDEVAETFATDPWSLPFMRDDGNDGYGDDR